jgi:hypothetical protein
MRSTLSGEVRPDHLRLLYLFLAAACLLVALRFLKRSSESIGVLVRTVVAAATVAMAVSAALVLLAAAALLGTS